MLSCIVREGRPHGPVRLLFGVNRFEDLFCLERLEEYRSRIHDFSYEIAIRDHDERWSGNNGYVTELLKAADLHGGDIDVYICGPPAMLEDACARLSRHGVADERIFIEKFAATGSTRAS
jgi:benzoate/toluate 1,2-dioxygenase reductase subunit